MAMKPVAMPCFVQEAHHRIVPIQAEASITCPRFEAEKLGDRYPRWHAYSSLLQSHFIDGVSAADLLETLNLVRVAIPLRALVRV